MTVELQDLLTAAGRILNRELPEEYRFRDEVRGGETGDLEAYLHGFGHLLDLVRATVEQAHADSFAEPVDLTLDPGVPPEARRVLSIQPWLIPYLAELVGAELVAPDPARRTEELNNAVTWYKSKGTLRNVDQVGDVVAGTETSAREGWRLTLACPRVALPPFTVPPVADAAEADPLGAAALPLGTPDLRRIDRAVIDPSGASPLYRLRYPRRDPATGQELPAEEVFWRHRSRGGAPCFPGHYDDAIPRTPDLRDPAVLREPGPHPRRTIIHVRTPDGLFEEGLLARTIPAGTDLVAAATRAGGWSRITPREIFRALGETGLAESPPDKVVIDLEETFRLPTRGRVVLEDVLVRGSVEIGELARLRMQRAAAAVVTIVDPHDRGREASLWALDCLFGDILSADGWAELVHCTVLGDLVLTRLNASDCIFAGTVDGVRCATSRGRMLSCIRYSRVPPEADLEACAAPGAWTNTGRRPTFVQRYFPTGTICQLRQPRFGEPGAGVLDTLAPPAIRQGAEDEGEMGAHHHLYLGAQLTALTRKLRDFLPLGQEIALRYDPLMALVPPRLSA